jgi:hypothetical protein
MPHEFLRAEDLFVGELQIPFLDRNRYCSTLTEWSNSEPSPGVLWLFGGESSGKTRLAIEITRALVAGGWEPRWLATPRDPVAQLESPTRLVINVELRSGHANAIRELIAAMAGRFRTLPESRTILIVRSPNSSGDSTNTGAGDLRFSETELAPFSIQDMRDIGTTSAALTDTESQILEDALNTLGESATPFLACAYADTIKAGSFSRPPTNDQCIARLIEGHVVPHLRERFGFGPVPSWMAREIVVGAIFGWDTTPPDAAAAALEVLNDALPQARSAGRHLHVLSLFWLVHYLVTARDPATDDSGSKQIESSASAGVLQSVIERASRSPHDAAQLCTFLLRYIFELKGGGLWSPLGRLQWVVQGRPFHDLLPVVASYIFAAATNDNIDTLRTIVDRTLESLDSFGSDKSSYSTYLIFCVNVATAVAQGKVELDDATKLKLLTIASRQLQYVDPDSDAASYLNAVNQRLNVSLFALPEMIGVVDRLVDHAESTRNMSSFNWAATQLSYGFNAVSELLYITDVGSDLDVIRGLLACERLLARLATPVNAASPENRRVVTYFLLSLWRLLGIASTCVVTEEASESYRAVVERLDAWQAMIVGTQEHVQISGFQKRIEATGGFAAQVLADLSGDFTALWEAARIASENELQRGRFIFLLGVMYRLVAQARARGSREYAVRQATKHFVGFLRSGAVPRDSAEALLTQLGIRNA